MVTESHTSLWHEAEGLLLKLDGSPKAQKDFFKGDLKVFVFKIS